MNKNKTHKQNLMTRRSFALSSAFAISLLAAIDVNVASAGDGCGGVVRGLSSNYNLAKGTGFLAVRSRPTSKSTMRDTLFNGEQVRIFSRSGNWYEISYSRGHGWAYAKYIRNECGY